ncbi:DUF6481 family protein [Phreatobacter stygius]|uniref:Uncharacterized protein n=1 Tax=Phreatobacter stygius TaxID=1940610 RepID=A0A4D7BGU1_9HYPH|nr:DUF6481 family protein [Phreatobacter stygius]QCI68958.1 hypothetical protein E8M01_34860 [Phreatobacter stygius]
MSIHQQTTFTGRRETAEKAKQSLLEKFRSRPGPDHPETIKREAARRAVVEAREAREAAREAERAAKAAQEPPNGRTRRSRAYSRGRAPGPARGRPPKAMLREAVLYATQRAQRGSRR